MLILIRIRMLRILSNTDVESDREKWGKTNSDISTFVPHYNHIRIRISILDADTDTDAKKIWITISTFPPWGDTPGESPHRKVGGHDGSTTWWRSPIGGVTSELQPSCTGFSRWKLCPVSGWVTAAPSASYPSWRCHL